MRTIRILLAMCLLVGGGSTTVLADGGGGLPPLCYPGTSCPVK